MANEIWCLFSHACEYGQPHNNLVAWWIEKPTAEMISDCTILTVKEGKALLSGAYLSYDGREVVEYTLEKHSEGKI